MSISDPLVCVCFFFEQEDSSFDLSLKNSRTETQVRLSQKIQKQVRLFQTKENPHTKTLVMSISDKHQ
jgi:hypothetical protein